MFRPLLLGLAALSALPLLAGCGGDDSVVVDGGGGGIIKQLGDWAGLAEDDAYRFHSAATEFRPPSPPVGESELKSVSRHGAFEGLQAQLAVDGMSRGTNLGSEEAKNLTCYLLTEAANGELSLDPAQLERQIIGYIEDRFIEQVPQFRFREAVNNFIEAVIEAESEGEAAVNSALATACL